MLLETPHQSCYPFLALVSLLIQKLWHKVYYVPGSYSKQERQKYLLYTSDMHFFNLGAFAEWPASISKLSHAGPWVETNLLGGGGGPNISDKVVWGGGGTNLRGI